MVIPYIITGIAHCYPLWEVLFARRLGLGSVDLKTGRLCNNNMELRREMYFKAARQFIIRCVSMDMKVPFVYTSKYVLNILVI